MTAPTNADFRNHTIAIKALTGSHNYNLNTRTSDEDWKYFMWPDFNDLYSGKFFTTPAKQSDDLDFSVHDVRKLTELVWKANVNFIEVLYSCNSEYDPMLTEVFFNRDRFATMNVPAFKNATYGSHKQKMEAVHAGKGTAKTDVLVEKFGYDTKMATHALRCLFTLERFARSGGDMYYSLVYDFGDPMRDVLLSVKAGEFPLHDFDMAVMAWHSDNFDWVMNFFNHFVANEVAHAELEALVKDAVRVHLK